MKRSLFLWQLFGATFTAVVGTLLHFLFGITESFAVAPFSAINESTWDHMKILFFPMLVFAFIQNPFFKKEYPNFWKVKLAGITLGALSIPVLFYTTIGIFGSSPAWLNVTFFFLADLVSYALESYLYKKQAPSSKGSKLALALLLFIALLFAVFTFYPPNVPLFQDPITGGYSFV